MPVLRDARSRAAVPRPPSISGIALCRALRPDGVGPPWRGRDTTSGQDVVLRPLPASVDPSDMTSLPDHPHLTAVTVWRDVDGRPYLSTELATHRGLDSLLTRRGPLTAGETSTVLMAVGRALATLHAVGRVHGSVTSAAVLVDAAMRPRLDASLCRPAVGSAQDLERLAAEDVRALGAVAVECLGGDVPPVLRALVSAATDPVPDLRPVAADLVRETAGAIAPEGLRLTGFRDGVDDTELSGSRASAWATVRRWLPLRSPRTQRRRHAGPRRERPRLSSTPGALRRAPVVVGAALLATTVGAGVVWARSSAGETTTRSSAAVVQPPPTLAHDWTAVLRDLDLARGAAFANADATVLAQVDAPGSPALRDDTAAVRALADAHVQARGFAVSTSSVTVESATSSDVVLRIVDQRSAYDLVDSDGVVVASQPPRPSSPWQVHLVRVGTTWRVHDIARG